MEGFFGQPRTIILISPQRWDAPAVSKHHYARLLGEQGHRVFFVEPPDLGARGRTVGIERSVSQGVDVVRYRIPFLYRTKFHARWLFQFMMGQAAPRIVRAIGEHIDLVWDFDDNLLFNDLRRFSANRSIFHPVDNIPPELSSAKHAQLILSNNEAYMTSLPPGRAGKILIPHGTQNAYVEFGKAQLARGFPSFRDKPLTVGYVGNLDRNDMDWEALHAVVEGHPDLLFRIIGPYGREASSIRETARLRGNANVSLVGRMTSEEIIASADDIDIWFLAYRYREGSSLIYPHKINEFLATGKPILSNQLSFPFPSGAIHSSAFDDNRDMVEQLAAMRKNYAEIGRPFSEMRARFAIANSYANHIVTISKAISELDDGE